jgi:hypothetical protein
MAAHNGYFEIIKNLRDLAKVLKLTPEDLKKEVLLSKGNFAQTAWHMAEKYCSY